MYFNHHDKCIEDSVFLRFLKDSTIHGVKYLSQRKRTTLERIIWILVLLASCSASAFFIYEILEKWRASPVIVSFQPSQTSVVDVPFASVTVCSANRFKKSSYDAFLRDAQSEDEEKANMSKLVIRQLDHMCSLSNTYSTYFNYSIPETTVNACERIGVGCENHSGILVTYRFPEDAMLQLSLAFSTCGDMIPLCLWEGQRIKDCDDIFQQTVTDMGFCCTFNAMPRQYLLTADSVALTRMYDNATEKFWKTFNMDELLPSDRHSNGKYQDYLAFQSKAGQGSGLSFLINTDTDEYFCDNHDSYGVRIHTHSPIEVPHVAEYGIAVAPSTEVFISLQAEVTKADADIKELHVEKRKCYYTDENNGLDSFNFYTASNCLDQCLSEKIAQGCNCVRFDLGLKFKKISLANVTFCEGHAFKCAKRVMANISKIGTEKVCPMCLPTCNRIEYIPQISSLPLRNDFTIDVAQDDEEEGNEPTNIVRPNASIVHIFLGSDNVYSRVRKNLYSFNDFFAHIGGILGLFLGLSVLSVLEPINMIFWKLLGNTSNNETAASKKIMKNDRFYGKSPNNYYGDEVRNAAMWQKNQCVINPIKPMPRGNRVYPMDYNNAALDRY